MTFNKLYSERGLANALLCIAAAVFFILLVIFIIRPAMFWIIKETPKSSHVSDNYVYSVLMLSLLSSYHIDLDSLVSLDLLCWVWLFQKDLH